MGVTRGIPSPGPDLSSGLDSLAVVLAAEQAAQSGRKVVVKARNCGLQAAVGKLIAFTDADCIPQKDWHCLMTRREIFDEVGFFDERPRGADVIFVQCVLSLYGAEAVLYQPDAVVDHTEIQSAFVYFKKSFIYGRSARSYSRIVPARLLRNTQAPLAIPAKTDEPRAHRADFSGP